MNPFKVISPDAADEAFRLIGKEWMLITAEAEGGQAFFMPHGFVRS